MIETERLVLRRLTPDDADFVFRLVNDPAWLTYIGDRGVRTREDAVRYIVDGPMAMHAKHGFGLDLVVRKDGAVPIGICGLLKRDTLDDVDIGFAFDPEFRGRGLAREAAAAVLADARQRLGLDRILAITLPGNAASIALLERLGFVFERMVRIREDGAANRLYVSLPA